MRCGLTDELNREVAMIRELRIAALVAFAATSLSAQFRPAAVASAPQPTREIGAVFIGMASCCESETASLLGPMDSVRQLLRSRALRDGKIFRMIGVSLDWSPDVGWNYLKQFGEFDEIGVGSNWYGTLSEVLMFTDNQVDPVVPQIVIYERTVTRDGPRPTFGARTILKQLCGHDEITKWLRDGSRLP
jgi:hypothetical protein